MHPTVRKFVGYLFTGGTAAVVDTGVFALLVAANIGTLAAAALSFGLAAVVNFTLSTRFVFGQRATTRAFYAFMAGALCGLVINVATTLAGIHLLGWMPVLAKLLGIAVAFVFNFMLNLWVVFPAAGRDRPLS